MAYIIIVSDPKFKEPINNVTIPVGREAMLKCAVEDLGSFKVSFEQSFN